MQLIWWINLPNNVTLSPVDPDRNVGVLIISSFCSTRLFCFQINFLNIRDHRHIHKTIDRTTASASHITCPQQLTTATLALSLLFNMPATRINRLQLGSNYFVWAVICTPKFHITPILKFLYWLTMNQIIQYKVVSLTHKSPETGHPIFASFSHSHLIVLLDSHMSSRIIVPLSLLVETFQTDHSITVLQSYGKVFLLT